MGARDILFIGAVVAGAATLWTGLLRSPGSVPIRTHTDAGSPPQNDTRPIVAQVADAITTRHGVGRDVPRHRHLGSTLTAPHPHEAGGPVAVVLHGAPLRTLGSLHPEVGTAPVQVVAGVGGGCLAPVAAHHDGSHAAGSHADQDT